MSAVGKSIRRVDGIERVTGQLRYAVDTVLPRMLQAAIVRSPHPHARILRVDTGRAQAMPGVRAVITGRDAPFMIGGMIADQPFLATDRVRYVGEPVAAVAAETALQAQMAAEAVVVEYEPIPAVFDMEEALKPDAPLVHETPSAYRRGNKYQAHDGTNICHLHEVATGDEALERAFASADRVFEDVFTVPAVSHTPMEPYAATAAHDRATGEYTIWSAADAPHRRLSEIAEALGLESDKVRIISTAVGGGFGGRGAAVPEMLAVALARQTKGLPVHVAFSREEVLTATQTRVATKLRVSTAMRSDGTIIARKSLMLWENGAYASKAPEVASRGGMTIIGPYRIPHVSIKSVLVYTNKQPSGAFRGFGTTQTSFACEVHMDRIASELGMDPLELRLKNGYAEGDLHFSGQKLHGVGLRETLEKAAEAVNWHGPHKGAAPGKRYGRGIACMIKGTNTPTVSTCIVRLVADGSLHVLTSSVEIGAGQKTVIAQFASEASGIAIGSIKVSQPDTRLTPYDFGCTSSRNTFHMGNAVKLACEDARGKFLEAAARCFGLPVEGFELEDGVLRHAAGQEMTVREAMKCICPKGTEFIGEGTYSPAGSELLARRADSKTDGSIFWLFVTHAVEVEVDTETGQVDILHVAAAHDVGRAINPLNCRQQIEGSVIMGVSLAMLEELKTENGRVLNDALLDYKFATSEDAPRRIDPIIVESVHPEAPYGAKGVGEPAAAATAPAIANAIHDACGIWLRDMPFTPERVLGALRNGKETAR